MKPKSTHVIATLLFFLLCKIHVQAQPSTIGYTCAANQTAYPCQTYVFYRSAAPDFLDLASIGDLFSVSRLMISNPSNISSPASPLITDQSLFIPISCSCNTVNSSITISYAPLSYTIKGGNTFYIVSTQFFQNLTTYQSVEVVNPTFEPTRLNIGDVITFPIFCKCPNVTQVRNGVNYLVSYVFQPSDSVSSIASRFGATTQSITDVNGNNIQPFDTVFVPVSRLPNLTQPVPLPLIVGDRTENKGAIIGLGVGLGVCAVSLVLVLGACYRRERMIKKKRGKYYGDEDKLGVGGRSGMGLKKGEQVNLMADVSGCLDKYRVFGIDDLREATHGFDEKWVIQGSVYKGSIDGEVYAIKKMKWNAYDELKILQKVLAFYCIYFYFLHIFYIRVDWIINSWICFIKKNQRKFKIH